MLMTNDVIGRKYRIIKKIGAGSFGTIYLGKFLNNGKDLFS